QLLLNMSALSQMTFVGPVAQVQPQVPMQMWLDNLCTWAKLRVDCDLEGLVKAGSIVEMLKSNFSIYKGDALKISIFKAQGSDGSSAPAPKGKEYMMEDEVFCNAWIFVMVSTNATDDEGNAVDDVDSMMDGWSKLSDPCTPTSENWLQDVLAFIVETKEWKSVSVPIGNDWDTERLTVSRFKKCLGSTLKVEDYKEMRVWRSKGHRAVQPCLRGNVVLPTNAWYVVSLCGDTDVQALPMSTWNDVHPEFDWDDVDENGVQ
ncbi:unnamed protein product, partial [Prorocentrum cordatum]